MLFFRVNEFRPIFKFFSVFNPFIQNFFAEPKQSLPISIDRIFLYSLRINVEIELQLFESITRSVTLILSFSRSLSCITFSCKVGIDGKMALGFIICFFRIGEGELSGVKDEGPA